MAKLAGNTFGKRRLTMGAIYDRDENGDLLTQLNTDCVESLQTE